MPALAAAVILLFSSAKNPERNFALANKEKPATQRSADKKTGFRVVVTKEKLHFSGHIAK